MSEALRTYTDARTEDTNPDINSDVILSNDVSAGAHKKVKYKNILGTILVAIRNISAPADDDFIQWKSGAPTNRSVNEVRTDIDKPAADLTDAATIATDASLGSHFRVTLGGDRTLGNPTNMHDGQEICWEIIQDATGTRLLTLDSKFTLGTTIASTTLTTTASKRDFLTAKYNSGTDKLYVTGFVKGY